MVTGHVHRQLGEDLTERTSVSRHREADRHPPGRHAGEPVVGVRGYSVPADACGIKARRDGLGARIVRAGQHHSADSPGERGERRLDVRQALVVVQMVGFDVGDERDVGRQQQERPVALVRLGHEVRAGSILRAEPGLGEDPADDVAGVGPALAEHRGEHRGGGGLAVRPGHRDHPQAGHDRGERGGPVHHPHPAPGRLGQFRVVRADGARHHQRVAGPEAAEVAGCVPDVHARAELAQLAEQRRIPRVAARHGDAPGQHDARDSGHARPADAGEVHPAEPGRGHWVSWSNQVLEHENPQS